MKSHPAPSGPSSSSVPELPSKDDDDGGGGGRRDNNNNNIQQRHPENDSLAPFNPTCQQVQLVALEMLSLSHDDVLFDLGCGDARLLTRAAQQIDGLRCIGIEMDPVLVQRAMHAIQTELPPLTQKRIQIRRENLVEEDPTAGLLSAQQVMADEKDDDNFCRCLSLREDATAIYMYLLPKGLARIKPLLDQIVERRRDQQKRLRVVTYMFQVHGWTPAKINDNTKGNVRIYLYEFGY